LPRSALFATVFSSIIMNPIENVPFAELRPPFLALFRALSELEKNLLQS
jgi:hypothetical protein